MKYLALIRAVARGGLRVQRLTARVRGPGVGASGPGEEGG
jgi:hypothetical protein